MADIVVILITKDNDYQQIQAAEAEETAKKLGLTCRVVFGETPIWQIHQIFEECLNKLGPEQPKMLLIEPMGVAGFETALKKALARGIKVGVLHQEFPDFKPTVSVTSNPAGTGTLQGKQCKSLLRSGGNILLVAGPKESSIARAREEALKKELANTNISVVDTISMPSWNGDNIAMNSVRRVLKALKSQDKQVDLIACQNDSLALAAKIALGELHQENIPVLGIDGTPSVGCKEVDDKVLTGTVVTPSGSGEAIRQLVKENPAPKVLLIPTSYPAHLAR